jgi:predicted Zn-dependent protease
MQGPFRIVPLILGLLVVGGMLAYGCREGPFGRRQVITISPQQEARLGAQAFSQILSESDVISGGPSVEAVQGVGRRLARAAEDPQLRKQLRLADIKFAWEFKVVRSRQVNAFCLPGGKVVVYTGILPVCRTEAGLATVMGHEIGHALARHGAERMTQTQLVQIGELAAAASLGDMDPKTRNGVLAALGVGAQVGVLLPFSRSHESEADHIGLLLMARAGYQPAEAIEFWQRMERMSSGGRTPQFLSTHPAHATRIQDLHKWLPEAQALYEKSRAARNRRLPGVQ